MKRKRTKLPDPRISVAAALLFAASRLAGAEPALTLGAAAEPAPTKEPERWSSFLPFMSEEALKRGYELPLPFGASVIYNHIERDIRVDDLRLGLNGGPPQSVSRFVDLGSNSRVDVAITRFDAWLLPFLNVYGILGYVHNESFTKGTVTIPTLGPPPGTQTFDFTAKTVLDGVVGGVGLTLATGFKDFFLMADANYSQTDIGFDDSFRALVVSFRSGWNGKIGGHPTRIWAGAMYWDTRNIARSTVNVPGQGLLAFEVDQGPANPWNASVGTSVGFSKHWEGLLEYGFNLKDVQVIAAGLTFRF
jgi:hypothetical protein